MDSEKFLEDFSSLKGRIHEDCYFESKDKSEDINKIIIEGLDQLADYNPLTRVIIDIQGSIKTDNYYVEMINLL